MRISVIIFGLISGFIACRKEPRFVDFSKFKNRYLICDSLQISENGSEKVFILGKGKGYDARFGDSYTIYSNPIQTFAYSDPANIRFSQYKDQQYTKIYFWQPGTDFHLGDYLIIEAVTNDHIRFLHKNLQTKQEVRYFYTAE